MAIVQQSPYHYFSIGDRVKLINNVGLNAPLGAEAVVTKVMNFICPEMMDVHWLGNYAQSDGGYHPCLFDHAGIATAMTMQNMDAGIVAKPKPHNCSVCKGRGFVITDILSGSTSPCPQCSTFDPEVAQAKPKDVIKVIPAPTAALDNIALKKEFEDFVKHLKEDMEKAAIGKR